MGFKLKTILRIRDIVSSCSSLNRDGHYGYIEEARRQAAYVISEHGLDYDVDTIANHIIKKIENN